MGIYNAPANLLYMHSMKTKRLPFLFVAPAALALTSLSASADFVYNDFSDVTPLTLNGNAAQAGNVLRLTPALFGQSGSAFTDNLVPLGGLASFSTYFQFQITNSGGISDEDGTGADGIVFAIQTQNNTAGGAGGGLGYFGITPSVGIEFDTFNNGVGAGDPNGNHVGININGSVFSTVTQTEPTLFNDGNIWNAWVDYDGTGNNLEVRWSQTNVRPTLPGLASNVNLATVLGQNNAFLGFTAGTGSAFGNQDILQWQYVDEFAPIVVPEPTSALFALGLVGTILQQRRRRA
jgi:Legume lectin domain